MTKTVFRVLGVVASFVVGGAAIAADAPAVEWKVSDGGNGHWYKLIVQGPISWNQANEYCKWRTDRANEKLLTKLGYIDAKNDANKPLGANNFNKEAYLTDEYNVALP